MDYTATIKYVHTSPRKLRLVADAVRSLGVEAAISALLRLPKQAGEPLGDAIRSAVANAKAKGAKEEDLRLKTLEVGGGPAMKRWHAVSRGQAHGYKKRMSHIRVVLTDERKTENGKRKT